MVSGSASLLPREAGLRRAEPGRGVEQGDREPLGPLALPEGDRQPPREPGLELAQRCDLCDQAGGELLQLLGRLVLQDEVVQGGKAVLERVAGKPRALASSVTGPREQAPLRREASIWAGERG